MGNSILMRKKKIRTNSGRNLKDEWNIAAKHVLYHKEGNYYNHLLLFPAALCDPSGYVFFKDEMEYINSHHLQHGKQLHVPRCISSMPGYIKMR